METKPRFKPVAVRSLLFIAIGAAGLIAIDQMTDWSFEAKLVWPIAWLIVAIGSIIVDTSGKSKPTVTKKIPPQTFYASASSSTATPETAPTSRLTLWLKQAAFTVCLFGLIYLGFIKLAEFFENNTRRAIANDPRITVTNPLPIGHSYNKRKELTKQFWPDANKIYDVFELERGQSWKWYFDRGIEYRIKVTGQEPFVSLTRNDYSGGEPEAPVAGMLQIRTAHADNRIEAYRLVTYEVK